MLLISLSEKRGSNPRPQPWQGCALPAELFSQIVRMKGLEPPRLTAPDPKSGVATNYTTSAILYELLSFYRCKFITFFLSLQIFFTLFLYFFILFLISFLFLNFTPKLFKYGITRNRKEII